MSAEIWFLIYVFAVYRLAELVSKDSIFDTVRQKTAKRAAAGGKVWKAIADWMHCPLCIGVWFSLPAAGLYASIILRSSNQIIVLWLGMAGMQYFLSSRNLSEDYN